MNHNTSILVFLCAVAPVSTCLSCEYNSPKPIIAFLILFTVIPLLPEAVAQFVMGAVIGAMLTTGTIYWMANNFFKGNRE